MAENAGRAAVRCKAIGMAELAAMEKHGKRLDDSSARRVIRDTSPLVHGSLDLRDRYDAHMEGIRQNAKATKPVLHFIVRFPDDLLEGPKMGRFEGSKADRQKMMLAQAVAFINQTHGGSAVFAARVDRDELGESIVDVFASPRYEKRTKRTPADEAGVMWASATRFGKELAEKHEDEIRRRHPEAKAGRLTAPRMVGIALQSDFAAWFQKVNGVALAPKVEKGTSAPDRLEKEAHDRIERRAEIQGRWDARRSRRLDARAEDLDRKADQIAQDRVDLAADLSQLYIDRADVEEDRADLERREAVIEGRIGLLRSLQGILLRAVSVIRDSLGLPVGGDLVADVCAISDTLDVLSAASDEPGPDTDRDGPGL